MKRAIFILLVSIGALPMIVEAANNSQVTKRKVEEIKIRGNDHISDTGVKEAMFTGESHWWKKRYFEMGLFQDDLRAIVTLYNNRGYLDAEISAWDTTYVNTDEVRIAITVNEGPQSKVSEVLYTGNKALSDVRLQNELKIAPGKPFSFLSLSRSTWNIINAYANEGYLDAQVEPMLETSENMVSVTFSVTEGQPVSVDTVIIRGNEKTQTRVVERELRIRKGELLTHQQIVKSQQNLYKTGIFKSVSITPERESQDNQFRDVYVRLQEAKTGELNFGLGYGSRERIRTSAELLQSNISGTGQRVGVGTKLSFAEVHLEGLYTAPYFILWGIRLDNTTYLRREGEPNFLEPNYVINRVGTEATIGKDVFQVSRISSTVKLENNYYSEINMQSLTDTADSRIRSIGLTFTRDSRKNLFNTSSGSFFKLSGLLAGSIFAGTNSFFRITEDYTKYYPYRPWLTLAFNISTGAQFEVGDTQNIPIYERFYAGGDQSVRGYKERSLSPMRGGEPIGGNFKAVLRMESRFKIYKGLHLALFFDTGNVWSRVAFSNLPNVRTGIGIGLRYETPIGVARLDYGIKINRRGNESPGQIHLTLGQAF